MNDSFRTAIVLCAGFTLPAPLAAEGAPACAAFPVGQAEYVCSCTADSPNRSVWGSALYTTDSDICTAARHAGVIAEAGGAVVALAVAGLPAYRGSPAHGVVSTDWGAYPLSYVFDANQR